MSERCCSESVQLKEKGVVDGRMSRVEHGLFPPSSVFGGERGILFVRWQHTWLVDSSRTVYFVVARLPGSCGV